MMVDVRKILAGTLLSVCSLEALVEAKPGASTKTKSSPGTFESVQEIIQFLESKITCSKKSYTPPSDGLGGLWGCYSPGENTKLWINTSASSPEVIENIKLTAISPLRRRPDAEGYAWSTILAQKFGKPNSKEILKAFADGTGKIFPGEFQINLSSTNGPSATERVLLITRK